MHGSLYLIGVDSMLTADISSN